MWSRFRRFRWQSACSKSNAWTHSSVVGIAGISIAEWVQSNEEDFNVPTWTELAQVTDPHLKREDNNARFFNTDYEEMISEYRTKLENEKEREILSYSTQIIDAISGPFGLRKQIVIDVGVGTGAFVVPITNAIGDHGCYIGLDISPAFLYYAHEQYKSQTNVKLNLSEDDNLKLPSELKGEVDVFFICATYHHFSNVNAMLNQIYEYLKPGGKLVIVEFKKHHHHHEQDAKDTNNHQKEWINTHIPFTEAQAKEEIMSNGFVFDHDILKGIWRDHFIHVYRKPSFY